MDTLTYFISERNSIVVISLVGSLTRSTLDSFPQIMEDTVARRPRMVIINCHDLVELEPATVRAFAELQDCLRSSATELRVCFLMPDLRKSLLGQNAVRAEEIKDNLLEAVGSFLERSKKAA